MGRPARRGAKRDGPPTACCVGQVVAARWRWGVRRFDSGVAFAERAKALLEEDLQEQDGWYDGEMEDVDEEPYRTDSDENEDELQEPLSAEEGSDIECFGEWPRMV